MKRNTTDHPKTKALARALDLPLYGAVGVLESLWHWTARHAPAGDVGRFSDADISDGVYWDRDPATLIGALVECRWLERHPQHRLVIHHWPDHADDAVNMGLARRREWFADGRQPKLSRLPRDERERAEEHYKTHAVPTPCPRRDGSLPLPSPPRPEPEPESADGGPSASAPTAEADRSRRRSPKYHIAWTLDSGFSGITDKDRREWAAAFPACDLDRQLAAAHVWLVANPEKAKKSNWPAFITRWLTKSQDRGGDMHHAGSTATGREPQHRAEKRDREHPEPAAPVPQR